MCLLLASLPACTTSDVLEIRPPAPSAAPSDRYAAIVVDARDGRALFAANANDPRYPASLTKMMTLYLLFEEMEAGRAGLDTRIPVSAFAASRPPTRIGFRAGQSIAVRDAIPALIVKSANDVAVAVAEFIAGSEQAFADRMTARARALGMASTTFRNASGLPHAGQRSTAADMMRLSLALRRRFPEHYHHFSLRSFAYNGQNIRSHNRLIGAVAGVDGIKTGYIRASGFNVATSVNHDGRSLVIVVMGGKTAAERNEHVADLIRYYLPRASRGPEARAALR